MDLSNRILSILHTVAANPWVYDQIQRIIGRERIHQRLKAQVAPVYNASYILDLGGGTGSARQLWPSSGNYICLDNDELKLQGLAAKRTNSWGLLADGLHIPVKSASLDVVLCVGVSHHIHEDIFLSVVSETMRTLRPTGRFIFLDATWNPEHTMGRFLWKYDRGSTPHTAEQLHAILSNAGNVLSWERFAIYHRYVLGVIAPRS